MSPAQPASQLATVEALPKGHGDNVVSFPSRAQLHEKSLFHALEQLEAYYHQLLIELVRIPSTIGEEAAAQDRVQQEMERLGLDVDRFEIEAEKLADCPGYNPSTWNNPSSRPNVVGTLRGKGGGRSLILNAHVDTVPVGRRQDWELDPLSGLHLDGKIFGRGAWDDKAGIIQLLWITEALQKSGIELQGDLVLQSVVEDETTANGTLACIQRGHVADAAVILDGTGSDGVIVSHMGQQMFEISIAGRPAPSVVSFRGHNPISTASRLVLALEAHAARKNDERNAPWGAAERPIFITITGIEAGDGPSVVPTSCKVTGHFGFCPPQTVAEARAELAELIATASAGDEWLQEFTPRLEFKGYSCEPQNFEKDNPVLEALCASVEREGHPPLRRLHITGAGDLRNFVHPTTGQRIPSCMYGPGRGRGAHVPNEYVETEDMMRVTRSVASLVLDWCGVSESR